MPRSLLLFLFIILLLLNRNAYSQDIDTFKFKRENVGVELKKFLSQLEETYPVKFFYLSEWLPNISIKEECVGSNLETGLDACFKDTDLNYLRINDYSYVIVKDPSHSLKKIEILSQAINSGKEISKLRFGDPLDFVSGKTLKIKGSVLDQDKRPLSGVTVSVTDANASMSTNEKGEFELKLNGGSHAIRFTYLNFEEKFIDLEVYADGVMEVELNESPTVLEDIIVVDKINREITTSAIGQTQIIMKEVKRAPALLGEVDIIKQIQTLAGVTTVGEAASGYNVRGGSVDQNLILYDGLPVFNSSHVFGFFSTFNAEAIKDVSFYRGGIPAEYGGRVSSVLDIRSKEGSYERWKASGGIGIVSSNLMVEGPIQKDKTSIVASVRTTYSDWLLKSIKSNYVDLKNSAVKFYDDALKISHRFTPNSKLTLSWYSSSDKFKFSGDSTYNWDTQLSALKWDQIFSSKLSSTISLGYGEYKYKVSDDNLLDGFNLFYKLKYPSLKADFLFNASNYKVIFGVQSLGYLFSPGNFEPFSDASNKKEIKIQDQYSLESGVYASSQFYIGNKLFIDVGARYSFFQSYGPANVNTYLPGQAREPSTLVDTLKFSKGDLIKHYGGLEPRLGLRYEISPRSSIKFGYNRLYQYLHLVTNTTAITPIDIWQPSGYYFKPQIADQVSLGYFFNFKEKTYDAFIETYYKNISNVLDFKDGARLLLNSHLETDLLQGKSRAYGIEAQITKLAGRLTGTLSYAYARSLRTINGVYSSEKINNGKEYPSNFDQPNILNLNWKYGFTRRHFFTGTFTYHTGRPITLPLNAFKIENSTVTSFSERNKFRIPDYHRLDVGFVIEGNHKRKKLFDGTWTFSVYNVYGRKNPYTIFFKEVRPGILRPYRLAVIGTILPSISYTLKI